nr:transcription factor Ouib [Aedes albopictus]
MTTQPVTTKLQPHTITARKNLKPVETTLRFKKADVRQCRLCLRVLPRVDVRLTVENDAYDFRSKILEAVGVKITDQDKLQGVCCSCLWLVDMVNNFREACRKADTIHRKRLLIMHPGSWTAEDSKKTLEDCHNMVKRNRSQMDALYGCFERKEEEAQQQTSRQPIKIEEVDLPPPPSVSEPPTLPENDPIQDHIAANDIKPKPSSPEPSSSFATVRKTVMCDICGEFQERSLLEGHRNRHLGVRPYPCTGEGCGKIFSCRNALSRHFTAQHSVVMPKLECQICHCKLKGHKQLQLHMTIHGGDNPRKSACRICGKMLYKCYLKDHMAVHTGELAYHCEVCDRSFAAMNNYITHLKKFHPDVECNPRNMPRRVVDGMNSE